MRLNNSSKIEIVKIDGEEFVKLDIDLATIAKIPLQIMYYKENGYKNFLIHYDYNHIKINVTKVIAKLKIDYLFKIAKENDIVFKFRGFPRCVFERHVLRPGVRWNYEDNIKFEKIECSSGKEQIEKCKYCLYEDSCDGICTDYVAQFKDNEFNAMVANKHLYDLNLAELENFSSKELVNIGKQVLEDYKKSEMFLRKKFMFVTSFPNNLEDSSRERFMYYIYNRRDDFDQTFDFLHKFFDVNFLENIKQFLVKSRQLALSFGLMGDDNIRKSFYFSIEDLNLEELNLISKLFKVDIKHTNPAIFGIDFKNEDFSFKVYYSSKKISIMDLKSFVKDVKLEDKRQFLKFSNSLIKPLNKVLLDYKYNDGELYSKRVDISLQDNLYRNSQFYALFGIPLSFFDDKEMYTLSFEMKSGTPEKVNFYYTLTIPEEEDEEEENQY